MRRAHVVVSAGQGVCAKHSRLSRFMSRIQRSKKSELRMMIHCFLNTVSLIDLFKPKPILKEVKCRDYDCRSPLYGLYTKSTPKFKQSPCNEDRRYCKPYQCTFLTPNIFLCRYGRHYTAEIRSCIGRACTAAHLFETCVIKLSIRNGIS
jgi:hypothetical protein